MDVLTHSWYVSYVGHMAAETTHRARPDWTLQDKIRKAREYAGMSQQDLADRLSIARASVVNWERGHTVPLRPLLDMVADATGVDPDWLAESRPARARGGYERLPRVDSNHQPTGMWYESPGTVEIATMAKPIGELRRRIRRGPQAVSSE